MGDITLVEGLFEMCEKHFGKKATRLILGLVLATVVIGCVGFIFQNFLLPSYHLIGMMIQDREHIIISRRRAFDVVMNALIAGGLYIVLYWITTFPARRIALKIEKENARIRREIELTGSNFIDLRENFAKLNKLHCDMQSHFIKSIDIYISSLEMTAQGQIPSQMEDGKFLKEICESREVLRRQLAESEKMLADQDVIQPHFELMPPSSTPDKSTSQP